MPRFIYSILLLVVFLFLLVPLFMYIDTSFILADEIISTQATIKAVKKDPGGVKSSPRYYVIINFKDKNHKNICASVKISSSYYEQLRALPVIPVQEVVEGKLEGCAVNRDWLQNGIVKQDEKVDIYYIGDSPAYAGLQDNMTYDYVTEIFSFTVILGLLGLTGWFVIFPSKLKRWAHRLAKTQSDPMPIL
jgi:hypothetical protein